MKSSWDWTLFLTILAIGALSLLVIYSISKNLAFNQLIFWAVGLTILFLFSFFDYRNWQKLSLPFYLVTIIFLFALFFIAEPIRGSVRWINLGTFRFQPSEITKVASILVLALFYRQRSAKEIKNLIASLLIILPAILLIVFEPDIGNILALVAIWLGISLVSGLRIKHAIVLVLTFFLAALVTFKILAPYQQARIYSFTSPGADPLRTGYSLIQSKIAIGSGQFFGRGLGQGPQSQLNFLPEAESDFIFASIAEQLGFLGAFILIVLFSLLIAKILSFSRYTDRFGQLIIVGCASYLILQFFVNIGMNLAILPVTGITLPLISYGGSSLISTLFLLGIIFSIKRLSIEAETW